MKIDIKKWFYSITLNKKETWTLSLISGLLTSDFTLEYTQYSEEDNVFFHEYPAIGEVFIIYPDKVEHFITKVVEGEEFLCFDRGLEFSKKVKYLLKEDFQYAKEYFNNK